MQTKWCNYCKITKTVDRFGKDSRTKLGLRVYCRECEVIRRRLSYDSKKRVASTKKWREKNRQVHLDYQKKYRRELHSKAIKLYGARCLCCGETIKEFLTLDHINGGGTNHRRTKGGLHTYREMIRENDHKKYRVLCMNCNHATKYNKICPHKQALQKAGEL